MKNRIMNLEEFGAGQTVLAANGRPAGGTVKAKQDKGRHCRINATVTEEERAALDELVARLGYPSISVLIGALAVLTLAKNKGGDL